MGFTKKFADVGLALTVVLTLLAGLVIATPAIAQTAPTGANAIYLNSGTKTPSTAYIDASAFCHTPGACTAANDDFCVVVFNALNTLPSSSLLPANGGVVDARGVTPTSPSGCSSTTPFQSTSTVIKVPSTLLLPAGTIPLGKVWVVPNGTKIIGQGTGSPFPSAGPDAVTIIQAASGFSGTMIQMGPNSGDPLFSGFFCSQFPIGYCTEIGIENLELAGGTNGANVSGIINGQSQDMSYVRRVSMYQVGGIGLKVWNNAQNSGPYSDISYNNAGLGSGGSTTECAEVDVTTLGIRGLKCQGSTSTSATSAVLVQAPNNTLKDVNIQGAFSDGILLKSGTLPASNEVLFNISGGSLTGVGNLVHIQTGTLNSQNVSIMGIAKGSSTATILDSVTSPATTLTDNYVAMYVLGVPGATNSLYSRFTTSTSTSAVTWGAGTVLPNACSKGSLYSCNGGSSCGTSGSDLYVCTATNSWMPII